MLLLATMANVVDLCGAGWRKVVEASVAKQREGVAFGKMADCVARAATEASVIACLSDRVMKREGSGWQRRRMSVGRLRNQFIRRGRSRVR